MIHNIIKRIFFEAGKVFSYIYSPSINSKINGLFLYLYTGWISKDLISIGRDSCFGGQIFLFNRSKIAIGNNSYIGKGSIITVENICAEGISIGNNCVLGEHNHITAANNIQIGEGLLTGPYVLISDNLHGQPKELYNDRDIVPFCRDLYSKGPIIIGNNVWIGEKVSILGNVNIGDGVIIGANSVVTQDIPSYSIAVGVPAKIVFSAEI